MLAQICSPPGDVVTASGRRLPARGPAAGQSEGPAKLAVDSRTTAEGTKLVLPRGEMGTFQYVDILQAVVAHCKVEGGSRRALAQVLQSLAVSLPDAVASMELVLDLKLCTSKNALVVPGQRTAVRCCMVERTRVNGHSGALQEAHTRVTAPPDNSPRVGRMNQALRLAVWSLDLKLRQQRPCLLRNCMETAAKAPPESQHHSL
mmetsp:Transcript_10875/g.19715  ORF Transcript_10875/g.19715 Transcript_10875/m.19715 type:complete len:204 (+) Transcript_10875:234-845(+)